MTAADEHTQTAAEVVRSAIAVRNFTGDVVSALKRAVAAAISAAEQRGRDQIARQVEEFLSPEAGMAADRLGADRLFAERDIRRALADRSDETPLADWERELICDRCRATRSDTCRRCSPDHETPF